MGDAAELRSGRVKCVAEAEDRRGVDPRRSQEDVAERRQGVSGLGRDDLVAIGVAEGSDELLLVGTVQVEIVLGDEGPDEREPVGVQSRRGDADDRIAGPGGRPVEQARSLDDADAAAGQVERVELEESGMLRGLPADEGTAGEPAPLGDPADELGGIERVEPPDGDVVEEEERGRPAADDVVGAHRDEVAADRVVAADRRRDGRLRADPVGRRDEHRLAIAGRDGDGSREAPEPAEHLGLGGSTRPPSG